jgi:molybdenum cofactor synthesis domain-containing protein
MPLIPLADAQAHVMAALPRLDTERVPLSQSLGLVLASSVVSEEEVPPFANTAVDGFAVRSADVADPPVELQVIETIAAGSAPTREVGPGQASRIMTGAPVPAGADAVVMVERTEPVGGPGDRVRVLEAVTEGAGIRGVGEDVHAGDLAVEASTVLGAAHVGVLATLGCTEVEVVRRPRVGVISTGDELVADGSPLAPGQIRDSNRPMLIALCRAAGFQAIDLGLARDDESVIESALRRAVGECDAVLSSGGVSMGDFDFVKAVLDRVATMRWMQLAIKPAKPFAFGMLDGVPVFGLPGNPVSSLVSFELFARPGIRAMAGHPEPYRRRLPGVAGADMRRRADGKTHFVRVRIHSGDDLALVAHPVTGQGSHQLTASAGADALAVLPDGEGVRTGGALELIPLN